MSAPIRWRRMVGTAYERCAAPWGRRPLARMLRDGLPSSLERPLRYLLTGAVSPAQLTARAAIEARRAEIAATPAPFALDDWRPPGLVKTDAGEAEVAGEWLTRIASVPPRWGMFLHLCATEHDGRMVELGSCVGISSAYLASSPGCRQLLAIEGAPALARTAQASIDVVGGRGAVLTGTFDRRLPEVVETCRADGGISLAYVDGDHHEAATVGYVETLLPALRPGGLVVLDDIYFSTGMWRAWCTLRARPGVSAAVNTGRFGLLVWAGASARPASFDLSRYTGWWRVRHVTT